MISSRNTGERLPSCTRCIPASRKRQLRRSGFPPYGRQLRDFFPLAVPRSEAGKAGNSTQVRTAPVSPSTGLNGERKFPGAVRKTGSGGADIRTRTAHAERSRGRLPVLHCMNFIEVRAGAPLLLNKAADRPSKSASSHGFLPYSGSGFLNRMFSPELRCPERAGRKASPSLIQFQKLDGPLPLPAMSCLRCSGRLTGGGMAPPSASPLGIPWIFDPEAEKSPV